MCKSAVQAVYFVYNSGQPWIHAADVTAQGRSESGVLTAPVCSDESTAGWYFSEGCFLGW